MISSNRSKSPLLSPRRIILGSPRLNALKESSSSSSVHFTKVFVAAPCFSSLFKTDKRTEMLTNDYTPPTNDYPLLFFIFFVNSSYLDKVGKGYEDYFNERFVVRNVLSACNPTYELVGGTDSEFFTLVFEANKDISSSSSHPIYYDKAPARYDGTFHKKIFIEFLTKELKCIVNNELICIENKGYDEYMIKIKGGGGNDDDDGDDKEKEGKDEYIPVVRLLRRNESIDRKYHIKLMALSDLKRYNKRKYKEYDQSIDKKKFLEEEFGPIDKETIFDIDISGCIHLMYNTKSVL